MNKFLATCFAVLFGIGCMSFYANTSSAAELPIGNQLSNQPLDYHISVTDLDIYEYILVNQEIAFCIDAGEESPKYEGEQNPSYVVLDVSDEGLSNVNMLKKLAYYGYGGPGYSMVVDPANLPAAGSKEAQLYTVTSYNMHKAANGQYHSFHHADKDERVEKEWNSVSSKALPEWNIELLAEQRRTTLVTINDMVWQRSPRFTLSGGPPGNRIQIPISEPYQLRKENDQGNPYEAGSVAEIKIGERFWIEAPKTHTGQLLMWNIESTMAVRMTLVLLKWEGPPFDTEKHSQKQRILYPIYHKGRVWLSANFEGIFSKVEVCKREARPDEKEVIIEGVEFLLFKKETDGTILYYVSGDDVSVGTDGSIEGAVWSTDREKAKILVTNQNGNKHVKDLNKDQYYFEEISTVDGYILPENQEDRIFPTNIGKEGKVAQVTVYNEKANSPTMDLEFTKVDAENPSVGLPGAEFELFRCTSGHGLLENHTGLIELEDEGCLMREKVLKGDMNGYVLATHLLSGSYLLVETKAPTGYQRPIEQWRIYLNAEEGTSEVWNQAGKVAGYMSKDVYGNYIVLNEKPYALPLTGAKGDFYFKVVGIFLLCVGGILTLQIKKEKGEKKYV